MTCDLRPMEFNVVVELDVPKDNKIGSILMPASKVDRDKLEAEEGTLVAVSPHAFTYADWPEGSRKPQVGDRVLIARFAGIMRERDGVSLKIVKDKDIIAVVEGPIGEAPTGYVTWGKDPVHLAKTGS